MMWHITGEDHDDRVGQHSVEMEQLQLQLELMLKLKLK